MKLLTSKFSNTFVETSFFFCLRFIWMSCYDWRQWEFQINVLQPKKKNLSGKLASVHKSALELCRLKAPSGQSEHIRRKPEIWCYSDSESKRTNKHGIKKHSSARVLKVGLHNLYIHCVENWAFITWKYFLWMNFPFSCILTLYLQKHLNYLTAVSLTGVHLGTNQPDLWYLSFKFQRPVSL